MAGTEDAMAQRAEPDDIQIDRVHGRAIRRAIGERLRGVLEEGRGPMPPRLRALLERMAAGERRPEKVRR